MNFSHRIILIGATLALGIVEIFSAKWLLGLIPKVWVALIIAATGFILVLAVIRLISPKTVAPEK